MTRKVLKDIRLKTGSILLRRLYIDKLKPVAKLRRVAFRVCSPDGANKLPSNYVMVTIANPGSGKTVTGLFEYSYGDLRLVGVDDEALADRDAGEIIHFFEMPLSDELQGVKIEIITHNKTD